MKRKIAKDEVLHHRTKERIRELGEVFTSEKYVDQMVSMIDSELLANEYTVFFEPTCGHGNFVIYVMYSRLNLLYKLANRRRLKSPHLHAITQTINNFWAIDIDKKNIEICRARVLHLILQFAAEKTNLSVKVFISKNKSFIAHLICAINWHIHVNEAISSLTKEPRKSTIIGEKWATKMYQRELDFNNNWITNFKNHKRAQIDYNHAEEFLETSKSNKKHSSNHKFIFASLLSDKNYVS